MYPKNLLQGEFIEAKVPQDGDYLASIATPAATNTTAVFELRAEFFTDEFVAIGLFDGILQAAAANITGASKFAWADVPGAQRVRVYRTDATGGDGSVGLAVQRA